MQTVRITTSDNTHLIGWNCLLSHDILKTYVLS
jgi:hypothetical protein